MKLNSHPHPLLKHIFYLAVGGLGGLLLLTSTLYLYLSPNLPPVETLKDVKLQTPLRIYSQDLKLIGEFGEKRRSPVLFEQVPADFVKAVLAAEDDGFYSHSGVDIKGLLRAAVQLISTGSIQTGGSTITMQVARNFFLTLDQTFSRKFNEILLALRIEKQLSKNEILTLYANKIYLGNRAYGIAAAAQTYYGLSVDQLNLAQLAMLAGLPKAPSAYNPIANPSRALIRRDWILNRMHHLGYIDDTQLYEALKQPVTAAYHGMVAELVAPYVAEMARREALDLYGNSAYTDGLSVTTTINSRLQQTANTAVITNLLDYDWRHGYRGVESNIVNPDDWATILSETETVNGLIPAIVIDAREQSLVVKVKGEPEPIIISWEDNLENLRLFITENRRSASLKATEEVFRTGDLIRVTEKQEQWRVSQLPKAQAALVSLDPNNGAIRALVGGFSFEQSHYNRITQANRQPGSNFKPFIYATALANGYTPSSIFNDAPVVFEDSLLEESWRPENDSGKFYGPTRLRKALYLSRNLISIRLLNSLGISRAIDGLERFGFDVSYFPRNLSLALGSYALPPLEIASGYATFANGGYRVEPHLISEIKDIHGGIIFTSNPMTVCPECDTTNNDEDKNKSLQDIDNLLQLDDLAVELGLEQTEDETEPAPTQNENPAPRVIDARVAYIMDSILKDVIKKGTGTRARSLGRDDIAGKTGTTNGPRDAWFSGYHPDLVTTTWLGFDQNLRLGRNEYGGSAALPIWIDFMQVALQQLPAKYAPQPPGLVTALIDPNTGMRVRPGTPNAIFELYLQENLPPFQEDGNTGEPGSSGLPEDIF